MFDIATLVMFRLINETIKEQQIFLESLQINDCEIKKESRIKINKNIEGIEKLINQMTDKEQESSVMEEFNKLNAKQSILPAKISSL